MRGRKLLHSSMRITGASVVVEEELSCGWVWGVFGLKNWLLFAAELDVLCKQWRTVKHDTRDFALNKEEHCCFWDTGVRGMKLLLFGLVWGACG